MKKNQLSHVRSLLIIVILLFSSLITYSQNCKLPALIPYRKGSKWGYCDSAKKIIIPCKYEIAYPFMSDYNLVEYWGTEYATVVEEGEYYRIDEKGKKYSFTTRGEGYEIKEQSESNPEETNVSPVAEPYVVFEKDNLKGVKDRDGSIVLSAVYDSIMDADRAGVSYYNTFFVKSNGKWGLVASAKGTGIPRVHESVKKISGYLQLGYCVMVVNKGKIDFYTIGNYKLNEVSYDEVRLGRKFIAVRTGNKWGLIEIESFKLAVPCIYDDVDPDNSTENLYLVKKNNRSLIIDCRNVTYFDK